ncbi:NADH-quinone oxidoreductase subunit J [Candidatus Macondimonas diazotrophica]|jgi:NADH-quinone oxidoreductase subunit J|uniref:NADH-quinone oxidoreductase subunit J n=1 Tax=Candidatus Macondimonas diazotrophica TaxID=2305248 RepID=A0A4Z0FBN5_9GAMM|nr:NADH-quinone oxidoreductase subunit J [Candidatus Macondimonas diazotrophica]TFZ82916.1 NADH-quinone oxidoreductase subunit J [Candidatus Macondimonas diazotrophica]HBG31519.1 NADH-quinone oxidoreductase subunit J [Gammaproteobacteria bacterium]HBG50852.1 NADH-quinone oxidoreductase subunit J [Gammaproteobacteria bacterium]
MFQLVLFYVFSAVLIAAALAVITARNPVHSVLFLVLAFFTSAALWLLIEAEFLAIVLVLVYVGAVMVLFLFVVMMIDVDLATVREGFNRSLPLGLGIVVLIVLELSVVLGGGEFLGAQGLVQQTEGESNIRALGEVMYTQYVYPFEIASVILLVAIVAAIALTLRRRTGRRIQHPGLQAKVRPEDRLRIIKMSSESRE